MKIKNKTSHQHMTALLATLGVCLLLLVFVYKSSYPKQLVTSSVSKQASESRRYYSKALKFSIDVPSKYTIEERFTAVKLSNKTESIEVSRSGTNFKDITGYVNMLEELNKLSIQERADINIHGITGMKAIIKHPLSQIEDSNTYFLYKDNWVFSLATSSPALYNDLDRIARSFQYMAE